MKVVIPGGKGHVGSVLVRHFVAGGHEVVLLSRQASNTEGARVVAWDGKTLETWAEEFDGSDVVINLAGRSVNCRYNDANLKEMMDSRVDSTRVVGQAISQATNPPKVWLQSSTATIYSHRFDAPNDERTGIIGGEEPGAPRTWLASNKIAAAWESELEKAETPKTRKIAMRSAMTMSIDRGSVFDVLCGLARKGLGGSLGGGRQYVSWVHEIDFARAVTFLIDREDMSGPINICSPNPLPQKEFMRELREAVRAPFGLPATTWMVEIGTWLMRTESELVLKSRRVVPTLLLEAGFQFKHPFWAEAAKELGARAKAT
jgi:uncharacterized protein (TIGR01777 family)